MTALMMFAGGGTAHAGSHSDASGLFTVDTRAPDALVVTPQVGLSKTYGAADPELTYTVAGAIEGETPAFTGTLARTAGEAVGTYPIMQGTLALTDNGAFLAANYTIALTEGVTFTITAKDASGLAIADIAAVTYNGAAHTPEPKVRDGDVVLEKGVDYALTYADNTHAGTATVSVTGLGNYSGTQDKTFTIAKAALTVTPDAGQKKVSGADDPILTYTFASVVAGEAPTFTGALARAAGEAIGTYPITQGTLALSDNDAFLAANYILAFTEDVTFAIMANSHSVASGLFTVDTRDTLVVTPVAGLLKTYGAADPDLTYTVDGAIEGETPAFTGALARAVGETVGTYAITQGTLALKDNGAFLAANYTLTFSEGVTFAITAKEATLTIADIAPVIYDGTAYMPEPEVLDGDTVLVKDVDYALTYVNNTNAGTATVTVTGQGNYSGTQDKTFTIAKAALTVTPDAGQNKVFGADDPILTYTFAGAVDGEMPASWIVLPVRPSEHTRLPKATWFCLTTTFS
jgi:hypothetical protein